MNRSWYWLVGALSAAFLTMGSARADSVYVQAPGDNEGRGFTFADDGGTCYVVVPDHLRGLGAKTTAPIIVTQVEGLQAEARYIGANADLDFALYTIGQSAIGRRDFCRTPFRVADFSQAATVLRATSSELLVEKVENTAGFPSTPVRVQTMADGDRINTYTATFSPNAARQLGQGVSGSLVWFRKTGGTRVVTVGSMGGCARPNDNTGLPLGMLVNVERDRWTIVSVPAIATAIVEILHPLDLDRIRATPSLVNLLGAGRRGLPREVGRVADSGTKNCPVMSQPVNTVTFNFDIQPEAQPLNSISFVFEGDPGVENSGQTLEFGMFGGGLPTRNWPQWRRVEFGRCSWIRPDPKKPTRELRCPLLQPMALQSGWIEASGRLAKLRQLKFGF